MTGRPFMQKYIPGCMIAYEAAFGADPADVTGAGWTWTDITTDVQHAVAVGARLGRTDNVGQAPTAGMVFNLNNPTGAYTPGNPLGLHSADMRQNLPVRRRISLDNGATWKTRYQGYATAANPRTDTSGKVRRVEITAVGKLGQLDGRKKPLRPALERATAASAPAAWWPMDDGTGATSFRSAVGDQSLRPINGVVLPFGAATPPAGATAATDLSGGAFMGRTRITVPSTTAWSVGFAYYATATAVGAQRPVFDITTTTGWRFYGVISDASPTRGNIGWGIFYSNASGSIAAGLTNNTVNTMTGGWHYVQIVIEQSGTKVKGTVYVDGVQSGPFTSVDDIPFGAPATVGIGQLADIPLITAGSYGLLDFAVWPDATVHPLTPAVAAYAGELAHVRLARVCAEEGVALDLTGTSGVAMGPQPVAAVLPILRECEAADHGLMYDGLGPGIGYRCRTSMHNQAPAATFNMAATQVAPPFDPTFDRQNTVNQWTVTRQGGQSVTLERKTGTTGTDEIGTEDQAATVNLSSDDQLTGHAGWLLGLTTVEGFRFPAVALTPSTIPALLAAVLAAKPGDLYRLTNPRSPSADLPPEAIDVIVEGWAETTTADTWDLTGNTSPGQPWRIAKVNNGARVQAAASTLSAGITAGATSALVAGPLWTVNGARFPLDITITGERITVASITGAASPQTFNFAARAVNGIAKPHNTGDPVTVADVVHVAI